MSAMRCSDGGLSWRCSRAELAPVPGARGLQRGPEGVGLAGRVAKADERQEEHDAGQDRQGRSAAAGRAEAELLQRYRQRQGDTCTQQHVVSHCRCRLTQALHVHELCGCPDVISACALCRSWRSNCLGAALAWREGTYTGMHTGQLLLGASLAADGGLVTLLRAPSSAAAPLAAS